MDVCQQLLLALCGNINGNRVTRLDKFLHCVNALKLNLGCVFVKFQLKHWCIHLYT